MPGAIILSISNTNVIEKGEQAKNIYKSSLAEEILKTKFADLQLQINSQDKREVELNDLEQMEDDTLKIVSKDSSNQSAVVKIDDISFVLYLSGKVERISGEVEYIEDHNQNSEEYIKSFFGSNDAIVMYNDTEIEKVKDLPVGNYKLYFDDNANIIYVNYNKAIDLSNNHYDGVLKNGLQMKYENGRYFMQFDGVDDYIQLPTLPSTIDFANGFSIEYEVENTASNNWNRILELCGGAQTNNITIYNYFNYARTGVKILNVIDERVVYNYSLNTILKKRINMEKTTTGYNLKVTDVTNNTIDAEAAYTGTISNVDRTVNYIGKSICGDPYFKGKIYSMKITLANGTQVFNYNFDECMTTKQIKNLNVIM